MMSYLQMVELTPGSRIYVYANIIDHASRCSFGTGCAAYVLNAFYTNKELKDRNLTEANGKTAVDQDTLGSIVGKHVHMGYWLSVGSRWWEIGQVLFCVFMVEVHNQTKNK